MGKILIIEDEAALSGALAASFRAHNFEVVAAENGEKGLQLALQQHPDIILLDITMPVMDGNIMLDKLRQDKWGSTAPVIVLTNRDDAQSITSSLNNNVTWYHIKVDLKLDEFVSEVRDILQTIRWIKPPSRDGAKPEPL